MAETGRDPSPNSTKPWWRRSQRGVASPYPDWAQRRLIVVRLIALHELTAAQIIRVADMRRQMVIVNRDKVRFLSRGSGEPQQAGGFMSLDPVYAVDVSNLTPGAVVTFTPQIFAAPGALASPGPLRQLPPGPVARKR